MKNLFLISMTFALLTSLTNLYAQNDFDAKSPQTDPFEKLCYPVKAGNSIKIPITVKCNATKKFQSYSVSIDTSTSFSSYYGWVKVDNVTQSIDSGQTKTYNLTIKPPKTPIFTQDGQYPIEISF